MKAGICALAICSLLAASCARHVVVERKGPGVDGARSVMTKSDTQWSVSREPAPASPPSSGGDAAVDPKKKPAP
jgi:hypothetical protein